jgi:hypothetical protein
VPVSVHNCTTERQPPLNNVFHSSPFFVDDPDIVSIFAHWACTLGKAKQQQAQATTQLTTFLCGAFHMSPPHTTMARTSV